MHYAVHSCALWVVEKRVEKREKGNKKLRKNCSWRWVVGCLGAIYRVELRCWAVTRANCQKMQPSMQRVGDVLWTDVQCQLVLSGVRMRSCVRSGIWQSVNLEIPLSEMHYSAAFLRPPYPHLSFTKSRRFTLLFVFFVP